MLWEEKDVLLEDVDRIEVIHGPGGTLWGANAVNGVINIITKDAKDTLGGFGKVGLGLEERHLAAVRALGVTNLHLDGSRLVATLPAGVEVPDLVTALVDVGARVTGVARYGASLEEAYLQVIEETS